MLAFNNLNNDYRVYREASTLVKNGYDVRVIGVTYGGEELVPWDGINIERIRIPRTKSLKLSYAFFWRAAYSHLKNSRYDVIHAHDLDALVPAAWIKKRNGGILVYDSHEYFTEMASVTGRFIVQNIWRLLERVAMKKVDRLITVGGIIAEELKKKYNIASVTVIRNIPPFCESIKSEYLRDTFGIPPEHKILLHQGSLVPGVGIDRVLSVIRDIPDVCLVIIGGGPDKERLENITSEYGLESSVHFHSPVPFSALHKITCSADIGLCLISGKGLSFKYSVPNKLFEYMMAGLPVIASDLPEISKIVMNNSCGMVIPEEDDDTLRDVIINFSESESSIKRMRGCALEAAKKYKWENEEEKLLTFYHALNDING